GHAGLPRNAANNPASMGLILPLAAGSPVTHVGLEVLEQILAGQPIIEKFLADRKTLLSTRPPPPKPVPGHKGPPPRDQATKDFLKSVADLVHDTEESMIKAKLGSGSAIDVKQLKDNIDNDESDLWKFYQFPAGQKPSQDLVKWCDE